ncbi:MAG: CRISPR system precrRNA processing endoribonuclease RAMP protein Cas6 [Candidatus Odinarchaeum yellowstonii]|uniref:CRISPR system precrRNA processing endoribonuclease RAMP protein Cas6 n=1 Tax=Odinarchaeota yellowstonii (strain LCB_4) TaxID=1841599 RepID=A0AAF0D237_ODILC|nr:MAG: CRISPR system precrRNA processing endoribonuclease RAMP protein Cas6 [Candidatus Odinarchaeum yellowstonii]
MSVNSPEPFMLQSFSGYAVRGLFYSIVKSVDESYAELIHNSKDLSPFSVSPIFELSERGFRPCFDRVNSGPLEVHFTLFEDRLNDVLISFIQGKLGGGEILVGKSRVFFSKIFFNELYYEEFYKNAAPIQDFKIKFLTPTYFRMTPLSILSKDKRRLKVGRSGCRFLLFPDPILLFKSIARIWRSFSHYSLDLNDFIDWLEYGGIAVSGYPNGIRTHIVYEHLTTNKWCIGFTGTVQFTIIKDLYDEKMAKIAAALLKFAEYSNVGGGRTAGLGVVKFLPRSADEIRDVNSDQAEIS